MRLEQDNLIFVMVDIQNKFLPHISDIETVIKNAGILNRGAEILDIPLLITEQNPVGLGKTIEDIYIPPDHKKIEKTKFSIFETEVERYIKEKKKSTLIIYGIESHICIMQSVLEAMEKNFIPVVVEDAVSSISLRNKETALRRIIQEGGYVVSTQMLLFEILNDANHPAFRAVSKLIKQGK